MLKGEKKEVALIGSKQYTGWDCYEEVVKHVTEFTEATEEEIKALGEYCSHLNKNGDLIWVVMYKIPQQDMPKTIEKAIQAAKELKEEKEKVKEERKRKREAMAKRKKALEEEKRFKQYEALKKEFESV